LNALSSGPASSRAGSILALGEHTDPGICHMPIVWLIPITLVIAGAGVFVVARRRNRKRVSFTQEPVSGQWLAEARSREEQHW
jgi:hypothetical protein